MSENTKYSNQHIQNQSYNETYEIAERLVYGYDPVSGTIKALKVDSSGNIQVDQAGFTGTGDNGAVTLTNANTAYAVPTVAPTSSYIMTLQNNSSAIIYIGYKNTNSNGLAIQIGGDAEVELGASQQVYAYSATAGVAITYTLKES